MFNHAPQNYKCPICLGVNGIENNLTLLKQDDKVYGDELVTSFINSFWIPSCEGHVIVVPNNHYENIYELPESIGHRIFDVTKKIGIAMKKAYKCDGITIRQNNEPASDQHAFHYHLHVFPRYDGDMFDSIKPKDKVLSKPSERIKYKNRLVEFVRKI